MLEEKPQEKEPVIDPEVMLSVLKEAVFVFDKHIGDYWIDSGTLLGVIRDNQFIPWENDIDMATWSSYITKKKRIQILKEMKKRGFEGYFKKDKTTFRKQGVKIDFWFLDKQGDIATRTIFKPNSLFSRRLIRLSLIFGGIPSRLAEYVYKLIYKTIPWSDCERIKIIIPQRYLLTTKHHNFRGIRVNIPEKIEDYLVFRYGNNWRTPDPKWQTWKQDGMVIK